MVGASHRNILSGLIAAVISTMLSCSNQESQTDEIVDSSQPAFRVLHEDVPIENTTDRVWERGWLSVPENRSNSASNFIKLPFILSKVPDSIRTENTQTILVMSGGPGNSSLNMANGLVHTPWGETHDILVLEQRGTKYAQPCLTCPEIDAARIGGLANGLATDSLYQLRLEATAKCYERLTDQGVDLIGYNTLATVEDIEMLRHALKFDQIILYGMSYSCNLMSAYAQTYPKHTAALIIDSPLPHEANYEEEAFHNVDQMLQDLLMHYTNSNALYEQWIAYMTEVEDSTFSIEVADKQFTYTRAEMIDLVLFRMSSHGSLASTVEVIRNLIAGNHAEVSEVISYYLEETGQALGMRYSVWVNEELPEENLAAIELEAENYPWLQGYAINDVTRETGKFWPLPSLYNYQKWPAKEFTGPVFILSGSFDPWTPPAYGARMKTVFLQAKHTVFEEHSHLPGFTEKGSADVADFLQAALGTTD